MPSLAEMRETVDRLRAELRSPHLDEHRLREIETILRLLMRHMTRRIADAIQRLGHVSVLEEASISLRSMRAAMSWVESNRLPGDIARTHAELRDAAAAAAEIVAAMEKL